MVQIIGLLLCLYLFVKGFEFLHRQRCSSRTDDRGGALASVMCLVCILGAGFFAFLLIAQGADPGFAPPRF